MTPAVEQGQRWTHVKRVTTYEVIGIGELQMSADLVDGSSLVIYRGDDGKMWAREEGEFLDGRFEPSPAPTPSPVDGGAAKVSLYREIDALGGAGEGEWHEGYSQALTDVLEILAERGFSEATDTSAGWIEWSGGECPVPVYRRVDVAWSDGDIERGHPASAHLWDGQLPSGAKIIAYRVVQP